jgi:hypothetical protein
MKYECDICNKVKEDVRFEGSKEKTICDSCLYKIKKGEIKEYIVDLSEIIVTAKDEKSAIKKVEKMIRDRDIEIASIEENK